MVLQEMSLRVWQIPEQPLVTPPPTFVQMNNLIKNITTADFTIQQESESNVKSYLANIVYVA